MFCKTGPALAPQHSNAYLARAVELVASSILSSLSICLVPLHTHTGPTSRAHTMSRYPYGLSPDITPTSTPSKLTKAQKSRARREPSGVFSLFSPPQIQQFREAFSLIDHDGDGIVAEQDLKHIFSSLGASTPPPV